MSRRSLQWRKAIRQAGGDPDKVIPRNAKGSGVRGSGVPKELWGEISKPGNGKGTTCTVGMRSEKEARFRKLK